MFVGYNFQSFSLIFPKLWELGNICIVIVLTGEQDRILDFIRPEGTQRKVNKFSYAPVFTVCAFTLEWTRMSNLSVWGASPLAIYCFDRSPNWICCKNMVQLKWWGLADRSSPSTSPGINSVIPPRAARVQDFVMISPIRPLDFSRHKLPLACILQ